MPSPQPAPPCQLQRALLLEARYEEEMRRTRRSHAGQLAEPWHATHAAARTVEAAGRERAELIDLASRHRVRCKCRRRLVGALCQFCANCLQRDRLSVAWTSCR